MKASAGTKLASAPKSEKVKLKTKNEPPDPAVYKLCSPDGMWLAVQAAIKSVRFHQRLGVSRPAIVSYLAQVKQAPIDARIRTTLKRVLKQKVEEGTLTQNGQTFKFKEPKSPSVQPKAKSEATSKRKEASAQPTKQRPQGDKIKKAASKPRSVSTSLKVSPAPKKPVPSKPSKRPDPKEALRASKKRPAHGEVSQPRKTLKTPAPFPRTEPTAKPGRPASKPTKASRQSSPPTSKTPSKKRAMQVPKQVKPSPKGSKAK